MQSCVVILNWNGWRDTIECLESVFRLDHRDFRVVVCDNDSADGSLEKIKQWARGELLARPAHAELSRLSSPPVAKPIEYRVMSRREAESQRGSCDAPLTLIQTGGNLGFAGGNNVGLRLALGDPACQYFWLLNNDTVVEADALAALLRWMQARPEVGLCGSLNLSYYSPDEVLAQGGKSYRRWTARARATTITVAELDAYPAAMHYVDGASMVASRAFLETVGLMEESYFLYFEELDWAMRARGKFELGYARQSVIYHKEGAATGSHRDRTKRSPDSDKHLARSRVMFTRRFFPWALPSVMAWTGLAAFRWFCLGDARRARLMLGSMVEGLNARNGQTRHSERCGGDE
jgi:GT2 family glycosyltransferase